MITHNNIDCIKRFTTSKTTTAYLARNNNHYQSLHSFAIFRQDFSIFVSQKLELSLRKSAKKDKIAGGLWLVFPKHTHD